MITAPWHSTKQSVHHNNERCSVGGRIEVRHLKIGSGTTPLCEECRRIAKKQPPPHLVETE